MKGYVEIRGADIIHQIKLSGVPYDGLVMKDRTWVPVWVKRAIDTYNNNEGYADMTLVEFLRAVKPT